MNYVCVKQHDITDCGADNVLLPFVNRMVLGILIPAFLLKTGKRFER